VPVHDQLVRVARRHRPDRRTSTRTKKSRLVRRGPNMGGTPRFPHMDADLASVIVSPLVRRRVRDDGGPGPEPEPNRLFIHPLPPRTEKKKSNTRASRDTAQESAASPSFEAWRPRSTADLACPQGFPRVSCRDNRAANKKKRIIARRQHGWRSTSCVWSACWLKRKLSHIRGVQHGSRSGPRGTHLVTSGATRWPPALRARRTPTDPPARCPPGGIGLPRASVPPGLAACRVGGRPTRHRGLPP